jgi:hypothetical protein
VPLHHELNFESIRTSLPRYLRVPSSNHERIWPGYGAPKGARAEPVNQQGRVRPHPRTELPGQSSPDRAPASSSPTAPATGLS